MALQSTSKIRVFVPSLQEASVLDFLQSRSVMEITQNRQELRNDIEHSAEFAVSQLEFSIKYLAQFEKKKEGMRNAVLGEKIEISEVEKTNILETFDWKGFPEKISALEVAKTDAERKLSELQLELSGISLLEHCEIKNIKSNFSPLYFVTFERNKEKIEKKIKEISPLLEIVEDFCENGKVAYVVFAQKEILLDIKALLVKESINDVVISENMSPKEIATTLKKEIVESKKILKDVQSQSELLAEDIDSLKIMYDEYASQREIEASLRKIKNGEFISVVEGWVLTSDVSDLENSLSYKYDKKIALEVIDKSEKEVARVVLNPTPFMAPIMEITKMFGTPKIEEVDPTSYYAFFFVLFFGFCLTDAGYGLILMVLTGFALSLKLPFEQSVTNIIKMFFYGGVSTLVMGILFGGWFGITPDQAPDALTYVRDSDGARLFLGQIFDPMNDLVSKIMPLAYVLGLLHLSLGLYLSGLIAWKAGKKERMYLVVIPLISSFVFASLTWVLGIEFFVYFFYASLFVAIWGLGESGNPILRVLKGFGSLLNECLGWFSNILSYSRLFALGLATGIIAMSFNIVAMTMGGMIPGITGVIVTLVVLAFGHTLNIALNVLGAYVHSSRLQFVEFFGMFLEGGGKILKPLRKVCRFRHTS